MINPFSDVSWNPSRTEKKKFAKSLVVGFPVLAAFFSLVLWLSQHTWKPFFLWLGVIGSVAGAVLWLLPSIARPFYVVWYFIASCIGFVVANLLLLAFYFLVITPIGLILGGLGKLTLRKGFDRDAATYWRDAEKTVDLQRYYRQF